MKKVPQNKYTERLEAIYDKLHFNADERFFANIVFSNFVDVSEEIDSIFNCEHEPEEFYQMMGKLSQFDDFMDILKEGKGNQVFDLFNDILSLKTNLHHDVFDNIHRIIYVENPLIKRDVDNLRIYDNEFDILGKKDIWYNYLKKIGMYDDYINTLNRNLDY